LAINKRYAGQNKNTHNSLFLKTFFRFFPCIRKPDEVSFQPSVIFNSMHTKGAQNMECPICKDRTHIEIDTHSDGFAQNLQECGNCGALWTRENNQSVVIHGATQAVANA